MIYFLVDQFSVELALMNENFVNAKELFDRMMEESLAKHNPNGQYSFIMQRKRNLMVLHSL